MESVEAEAQNVQASSAVRPACRLCGAPLAATFVDLGKSPLCESYVPEARLGEMEPFYPLHVYVCTQCYLVQLPEHVRPESIFTEYAYFSSYSTSWLLHARRYTEQMIRRFQLTSASQVVEIASNDGYLLQYFVEQNVPVLGIDPAQNVAEAAIRKGVPTLVEFFGTRCARRLPDCRADLVIANNVLAQVPDLNDFVEGLRIILKPDGVITIEVPHLVQLIDQNQFDTIYHEHFSYFSLITLEHLLRLHGLAAFDVEQLATHGGSLRLYAAHAGSRINAPTARLAALRRLESSLGVNTAGYYKAFGEKVRRVKRELLKFLIEAKEAGKSVVGYGAPGKGNTLLNYCGIRSDFLDYTVDKNPYKQGKYLPGTNIPIFAPEMIARTKPAYVLVLPWNLKEEILNDLGYIREWGGRCVLPIPQLTVI